MKIDTTNPAARTVASPDGLLMPRLRAVAGRLRRFVLMDGLAWIAVFLLASAIAQFLFDYLARGMRWSMRATVLALIVAGIVAQFWRRVVRPLRVRFGPAEIAKLVERRHPELSSLLISAVRFAGGQIGSSASNSPDLVASVIRCAEEQVRGVDFAEVLDVRRPRFSALTVLAVLAVGSATALIWPEPTGLWFARSVLLQEVEWPKRTKLIVELENDELVGARGDDLIVRAHADGVQPREVEIHFTPDSGARGIEPMVTVGQPGSYRYRYTFRSAQDEFVFYLTGGDDRTAEYRARLLERPRVVHSAMTIEPPAYARLAPVRFGDGERSARVLLGSRATIEVETNKPLARATLMSGHDEVGAASATANRCSVTFSVHETGTYHFALTDEVGLDNREPVRFSIRAIPDDPPRVRMNLPGVGDMITPEAVLPIEVEYADTYGLATAEIVFEISHEDAHFEQIPIPGFDPGATNLERGMEWAVASAGAQPGDTINLFARATDFDDVSGPNAAQSPQRTLRVVTREELLSEFARREQEYRIDFERLIDLQEQLRRDLLTAFGSIADGIDPVDLAAALTPLERRQRTVAGSVNVIRQQFEQILAELRVNRLDTGDEEQRLGDQIIAPLTDLARRDLVVAADAIRKWSREATTEQASKIDPLQVSLLSQMREVLASMIQWEGYQEVVNMLRDIIRLQQELQTETRDKLEDQARDVFED